MQTALFTGGSRGVGRGAAIGLAEVGFRVLATGRTVATANLPDSVERLACDHRRDDDTAAALARVEHDAGGLDVLVRRHGMTVAARINCQVAGQRHGLALAI